MPSPGITRLAHSIQILPSSAIKIARIQLGEISHQTGVILYQNWGILVILFSYSTEETSVVVLGKGIRLFQHLLSGGKVMDW